MAGRHQPGWPLKWRLPKGSWEQLSSPHLSSPRNPMSCDSAEEEVTKASFLRPVGRTVPCTSVLTSSLFGRLGWASSGRQASFSVVGISDCSCVVSLVVSVTEDFNASRSSPSEDTRRLSSLEGGWDSVSELPSRELASGPSALDAVSDPSSEKEDDDGSEEGWLRTGSRRRRVPEEVSAGREQRTGSWLGPLCQIYFCQAGQMT